MGAPLPPEASAGRWSWPSNRQPAGPRRTSAERLTDVPDTELPPGRLLARARERHRHRAAVAAAARLLTIDRQAGPGPGSDESGRRT
ncbi:hypothetical protein ACFZDG_35450 [Kitasatospora xanthocidica]|uniref:hypothetical protein n=1 Tax=Kitasatospora xanthocidica TaxID=83382 RepID=UPI0036EB58AC